MATLCGREPQNKHLSTCPKHLSNHKDFLGIYALFSLIQFILLKSLGMPVFDALIHSLTALSTGGFSNHDASIGFYALQGYKHARLIEYTIIFFMALGGMNFSHALLLVNQAVFPFHL